MESNFSTVLVQDPRLMVTDTVKYGIYKGGSNVTQSVYNAMSQSMSQILFNIAVPSENVIIDRKVLISSTVSIIITVNNVKATQSILQLGSNDGFQAFPLSSLFSTLSATINNTTVSCNVAEILAPLLLPNEKEELYKYHGTTPCLPDAYYLSYDPKNENNSGTRFKWTDSTFNNNVLGSYGENGLNTDFVSRGSFPFTITQVVNTTTNAVFTGEGAYDEIISSGNPGDPNYNYQVYITATFTEPLLLSPFLFGDPTNGAGFYGIQNMTITSNIGTPNKMWSTANKNLSIALNPINTFQNSKLIMTFLTPQPSQLLKSRNVVPYYSLPRFLSVGGSIPNISPSTWNPTTNAGIFGGIQLSSQRISSSSLQLNMIPDKLIICVRPQFASQSL